eukprot:scaffold7654_cov109-Isochrysis_galbana.AAC.1
MDVDASKELLYPWWLADVHTRCLIPYWPWRGLTRHPPPAKPRPPNTLDACDARVAARRIRDGIRMGATRPRLEAQSLRCPATVNPSRRPHALPHTPLGRHT